MSDLEPINPIKDEGNATSVISLVPGGMGKCIKAIPEYVFDLPLNELEEKAQVTEALRKLRIAFWIEYERAHRCGTLVNMANVYKGVCSQSYFFKHLITNSFRLCYMLTPPQDYRVQMEEMLELAIKAERAVLETPIRQMRVVTNNRGESKSVEVTDAALAMVHHKIRESLQNRLQGMPVHRSMQINENRNFTQSAPTGLEPIGFSPEELNSMDTSGLQSLVQTLKDEAKGLKPSQTQNTPAEKDVIEITANIPKDGQ